MSSFDNHIHEELKNLLSKDLSGEKIETLIQVLSSRKPKIMIDRSFQKQLKETILKQKNIKKHVFISSFFTFQNFSLVSAVCASFLMIITFWNLFFPRSNDVLTKVIPASLASISWSSYSGRSPIPSNNPLIISGWSESTASDENILKKDPADIEIEGILSDLSDMSMLQNTDNVPRDSGIITPSAVNSPFPKSSAKMDMWTLATQSMNANIQNSDTNIDDYVSSIVDDFDAILADYSKTKNTASGFVLPNYPEQIPVYQKSWVFTADEIVTHRGQNIMTVMMHTEKDTGMLRDALIKKAGWKKIKKDGKLIYEVQVKDEATSFLVPKIQFSLVAGKPISVSVVSGME